MRNFALPLLLAPLLMASTTIALGCYREAALHPLSEKLDVWVGRSAAELQKRLGRPTVDKRSDEGRLWGFTSAQGCRLYFRVDLTDRIGQAFWAGPEAACAGYVPEG